MKKSLLFVAALAASMSINAQESCYFGTSLSLTETATGVSAGTACGSTSLVDATIGADDSYKTVSINGPKDSQSGSFRNLVIDGVTLTETDCQGVQGNSNPKDIDGSTPASTLKDPATGAYFQFTAKGDGYLYVVGKMSSNKAYTAFEEGSAIPYQYAQGTDGTKLPQALCFDLAGQGTTVDGVENLTLTDHPKGLYWPEQIACGLTGFEGDSIADDGTTFSQWKKIGQNGVGYIAFPVFDGLTYKVCANGSKLSGLGFYTSTEKAQSIKLTSDNEEIVFVEGGNLVNGIDNISADKKTVNALDPMYNLAGQRVSGAYKGIVLQNGRKFINK